MVLRPNLLSVYKNASEVRLHKQIDLSDLTAVTYLKDPKGRRDNVFGLFSPPRNFYLQANDENDARSWVELIKREARIDEVEQEMTLGSPLAMEPVEGIGRLRVDDQEHWDHERLGSSSPEPSESPTRRLATKDGISIPGLRRPSAYDQDYSGDDLGLSSDFSDTGLPQGSVNASINSRSSFHTRKLSDAKQAQRSTPTTLIQGTRPGTGGNGSQLSIFPMEKDEERVIWHGYLLCLKSKGGVRQWKKYWVVLRPKNLAFYKSKEVNMDPFPDPRSSLSDNTSQEYAAHLIIPLSNIISAVEIDPVSKSKLYCMQVIAEEKNYRLCASSEDALANWLGALKSQLAKKEAFSIRNIMKP